MSLWTTDEIHIVCEGVKEGLSYPEIGIKLNRTGRMVSGKVKDLKAKGILPTPMSGKEMGSLRIPLSKKISPRFFDEVNTDDDNNIDIFNLDYSIPTIITTKSNQCKFPTPLNQVSSAHMRLCGNQVYTKGTPWRKEVNERCQWCFEHIKIVYDPPHAWLRKQQNWGIKCL